MDFILTFYPFLPAAGFIILIIFIIYKRTKESIKHNEAFLDVIKPKVINKIPDIKARTSSFGAKNGFPHFRQCDLYITNDAFVIIPKSNGFIPTPSAGPLMITKEGNDLFILYQSKIKIKKFSLHSYNHDIFISFTVPLFISTSVDIKLRGVSDSDKQKMNFLT